MDLVFAKYAQPLVLIDKMILTCRFTEFINEVIGLHNKEQEEKTAWDFYIHRVFDMSFADFLETLPKNMKTEAVSKEELTATVKSSAEVLNGFNPCQ